VPPLPPAVRPARRGGEGGRQARCRRRNGAQRPMVPVRLCPHVPAGYPGISNVHGLDLVVAE